MSGFFLCINTFFSQQIVTQIRVNNNGTIDQTGTTVLWGSWHHIEVSRSGSTLKIFVNGSWIGIHNEPSTLVRKIRSSRRKGLINPFISIAWYIQMNEIFIFRYTRKYFSQNCYI